MKITKLTLTIAAALYGASVAHAALGNNPMPSGNTLSGAPQLTAVTAQQMAILQQQQAKVGNMLQNDGLNLAVKPLRNKFQPEADISGEQVYLIRLATPAVSQQFQHLQAAAALPVKQQKLYATGKSLTPDMTQYRDRLLQKQQQVLQQIENRLGQKQVRRQFTVSFNGFSMALTQDEAQKIAELSDVASVQRSKLYQLHTDVGPTVIEADQVWAGNTALNLPFKGEGVIVGVIDTGINSDHPSFSAVNADGYQYVNPLGAGNYVGDCKQADFASRCNDKLIGIHSYPVITDSYQMLAPAVGEDFNGHGSHTASTAAGNTLYNVDFVIPELSAASDGVVIKENMFPMISGVAPRANIIAYQACFPVSGCPGEALISAIEDAVTDGVDVINFSIGNVNNLTSPWEDSIELAFLGAAKAGVATAASAGNAGGDDGGSEYFGYIDHASPWLLNVAATTTGRSIYIDTSLDNFTGGEYAPSMPIKGGGINDVALNGVVVNAADFGDEQCLQPFAADTFTNIKDADGNPILDENDQPAPVIVVCQRGENGRVEKSSNVAAGGASGFILYNTTDWGDEGALVFTDRYAVPGIHISNADWWGFSSWLQSEAASGHWLTISATDINRSVDPTQQDRLADFSSRGPSFSNPTLLVPSVSAPGVNIYAAYRDESPLSEVNGEAPTSGDFAFLSGTSMASPHVAGALALLTQAHPDWTVAQKYSALQLTAEPEVVIVRYEGESYEQRIEAGIYRAGTGRINVKDAVESGLIMNETADNMLAANPDNGGLPQKLNIPQLVDFHCNPGCSWIRTFTATKDGSWELSSDPVVNFSPDPSQQYMQHGIDIDVQPASFSLKAGETQTVMVTANITKTHDIFGNSEVELQSHLLLREVNEKAPTMRMPLVFKYDAGELPEKLSINMHGAEGSYAIKGVMLPEAVTPVAKVYKAVKPEIIDVTLPTDDDGILPWPESTYYEETPEQIVDESVHTRWLTVADNSKRVVVEVLEKLTEIPTGYIPSSNLAVYIGKDFNGDGIADPRTETMCASLHVILNNYCYIDDPEPGEYWTMVYNPNDWNTPGDYTYKVAYAVVSGDIADNVQLQLPANTDGKTAVTAQLTWQLPDATAGDILYSGIDIGTSANNPANVGFIPLRLNRGLNHISVSADKTAVRADQTINLTFKGLPNLTGLNRAFTISASLPAGLKVDPTAVTVSDSDIVTEVNVDNGVLHISGQQIDTGSVQAEYVLSTNQTNELCYMPDFGQNDPTFVDLLALGATPTFGHDNASELVWGTEMPFSLLFADYDGYNLYNNEYSTNPSMQIRGNGNITFSYEPYFWAAHYPFPYGGMPHEAMGVLWRGWGGKEFTFDAMYTPFNGWDEGITVAYSTDYAVVQWNGSRTVHFDYDPETYEETRTDLDDRFNFQMVMHKNTRFEKGAFEFYLGYQSLNFNGDGRGSVGVQGYRGQRDAYGPLEGHLGSNFAYEDLDEKLQQGLVICMDYQGPESSQFSVTVPVRVSAAAVGKALHIDGVAEIDGMSDIALSVALNVPGNITVAPIRDYRIDENTTLANVQVLYTDDQNSANSITVTGEHITAQVSGHNAGSTFTLTPEKDFHGDVEVTVTVTDVDNPTDSASTSFMLTVVSDGKEPVVVAPPVVVPETPEPASSGGSFGIWLLAALGLLCGRRRITK